MASSLAVRWFGGSNLAYLCCFVDFCGLGLIIPFLTFYVKRMYPEKDEGARTLWVGGILTAQYFASVFGAALLGWSSDVFGRKAALMQAMIGDIIFFAASGAVAELSVPLFVAARALAGLMIPVVPATAWLVDAIQHLPESNQAPALAKLSASLIGGMLCGNSLSIVVSALNGGIQASCFLASGFSFLVIFVIIPQDDSPQATSTTINKSENEMEKGKDPHNPISKPEGVKELLGTIRFIALLFDNTTNGFVFGGGVTLIGEILNAYYNWTKEGVSAIYAGCTALMVFWSIFVYKSQIKKMGLKNLIVVTKFMICAAAIVVTFVFDKNDIIFCFGQGVSILGVAWSLPSLNALAANYADKYTRNARGTILGITRAGFSIGQAISPIFIAALYSYDRKLPFILIAVMNFLGGIGEIIAFYKDKQIATDNITIKTNV
eukprot:g4418.t1